jgi:polyphosphate kinase
MSTIENEQSGVVIQPNESNSTRSGNKIDACKKQKKHKKLTKKKYYKELEKLQEEMVALQEWVKATGQKICIIFEGRDGAGKGGAIKAVTERVSPRVFQVVALPAPTERQKTQMYMQRYIPLLPAAGEVIIFDRSWYNRAGVERVMGFCTEQESKEFLEVIPFMEKAIVNSGIILLKYWLEVNMDEQKKRMLGRINDPRKIWKLSPMDIKSYSRWYDYSRAKDEMIMSTDTSWAPWYIVDSNNKKKARLNIIRHILNEIPYKKTPHKKVELPKRQEKGDYHEPNYPYRYIPQNY